METRLKYATVLPRRLLFRAVQGFMRNNTAVRRRQMPLNSGWISPRTLLHQRKFGTITWKKASWN